METKQQQREFVRKRKAEFAASCTQERKIAISEESFEMDPYSTESVHNAAHQIIYKNIYQKFEDIRLHRVSFEDEKVNLYRTAINKYSSELSEDK